MTNIKVSRTELFDYEQLSNLVFEHKNISYKFEDSSINNIGNIINFCIEKEICVSLMLKLNDFLKVFKLSHDISEILSITLYSFHYDNEEYELNIFLKDCKFDLDEDSFCYEINNNCYTGINYSKFDYYIKNYKKIALLM